MGHRRNRRRCRRRSNAFTRTQNTRTKPFESFENPASSNRWNRINPSTALTTHHDPVQSTVNWQHSYEAWQLRTIIDPQHQYLRQQIHHHHLHHQPFQPQHESQEGLWHRHNQCYHHHHHQNQQRPNDVVSRYIANQLLEKARIADIEAQRIHFFGGEVGDEVSLCAPMLQVVLDLWGGVDYLDP